MCIGSPCSTGCVSSACSFYCSGAGHISMRCEIMTALHMPFIYWISMLALDRSVPLICACRYDCPSYGAQIRPTWANRMAIYSMIMGYYAFFNVSLNINNMRETRQFCRKNERRFISYWRMALDFLLTNVDFIIQQDRGHTLRICRRYSPG